MVCNIVTKQEPGVPRPTDMFFKSVNKNGPDHFPLAMVNITNWCNLSCEHCFIYRDGNPSEQTEKFSDEPSDDELIAQLQEVIKKHGTYTMLWMGGEPLLKRKLLERGVKLFAWNIVTTNGTVPLIPLFNTHYVISIDGPPDINDAIRGEGSFDKIMKALEKLPPDFPNTVQAQCVVTRRNQDRIAELVPMLMDTPLNWMSFSFYVPGKDDDGPDAWPTLEERDKAVEIVEGIKERYPNFVRNTSSMLRLLKSDLAPQVTAACPSYKFLKPLYLGPDGFESPFCCYGNDVDCDCCGAWVVFHFAGKLGYMEQIEAGTLERVLPHP